MRSQEGPKALEKSSDALVPWAVWPARATNPVVKSRQGEDKEEETVEFRVTRDKLSHQPFSLKVRGQNGLGVSFPTRESNPCFPGWLLR